MALLIKYITPPYKSNYTEVDGISHLSYLIFNLVKFTQRTFTQNRQLTSFIDLLTVAITLMNKEEKGTGASHFLAST